MDAPEFLSLRHLPDDDDSLPSPIQPHLDTLFAEFARSRGRGSPPPPRSPLPRSRRASRNETPARDESFDFRALDCVTDYDSHLMCPICHVPFVDPVVLECDHTFCYACLQEHRDGAASGSRCPTCRTFLLSGTRKASRLIVNMCNEIKVRCPNDDCDEILPRGYIEKHATKECPNLRLDCPDPKCGKTVKRKNFVPDQCIHGSQIECDCGAVIELGKGDWLKHKDEQCPNTGTNCDKCKRRISKEEEHKCADDESVECPGAPYGCCDPVTPSALEAHTQTCPLARLAPHLGKQSQLLQSMQEQLALSKVRNEVLETGITKIHDILTDQVLPQMSHSPSGDISEVEEIERDHIPSATSHRDLVMPAHLRALTPSPQPDYSGSAQQHLLALQEALRASLERDMTALHNALNDLDARTSMQLMNETLRIKEDLAHTNAALFSTRSQVQWLLNRERVGAQREAMGMAARGRAPSANPQGSDQGPSTRSSVSDGESSAQGASAAGGMGDNHGGGGLGASPVFRPQGRRLSGSQERVKL